MSKTPNQIRKEFNKLTDSIVGQIIVILTALFIFLPCLAIYIGIIIFEEIQEVFKKISNFFKK